MYFLLLFGIELLVLLRRHPELFLKRPEKAGIILKPVHKTGFADTRAAADRVPAHPNPFFQDELVDGKPQICLKYMGNMVFADIKFPGQPFKRKILFNVPRYTAADSDTVPVPHRAFWCAALHKPYGSGAGSGH